MALSMIKISLQLKLTFDSLRGFSELARVQWSILIIRSAILLSNITDQILWRITLTCLMMKPEYSYRTVSIKGCLFLFDMKRSAWEMYYIHLFRLNPWMCFPQICNLGCPDIFIEVFLLFFNQQRWCSYISKYQWCLQTLAEICRNIGNWDVFRAVDARKSLYAVYLSLLLFQQWFSWTSISLISVEVRAYMSNYTSHHLMDVIIIHALNIN